MVCNGQGQCTEDLDPVCDGSDVLNLDACNDLALPSDPYEIDGAVIDGDHLVVAVSEQVCEAHVARLAAQGVSVIFAGPQGEDIPRVLARLGEVFGLRRVLLEGGGRLNAAFLAADAIDETSTLIYPVLDGQRGVPAIYDDPGAARPRRLELIGAETLEGGVPWLRHRVLRD